MTKLRIMSVLLAVTSAGFLFVTGGCDWSGSGSDGGFNTSQGAGINVNFSGVYRGELSGGKAVSGQNINTLTLSQSGNRINAVDNNGSSYTGGVGSPGLVAQPNAAGAYPAGAELVQGQINFSGINKATGRPVTFAGIVHVVSVRDIQSQASQNATSSGSSSSSSSSENLNITSTTRSERNEGGTTTVVITQTWTSADGLFTSNRVTTTVIDNATGNPVTSIVTSATSSQSTDSSSSQSQSSQNSSSQNNNSTSSQLQITEANSQYRLEGTWIESGGGAHGFKARSAGTAGIITVSSSTPTTPGPAPTVITPTAPPVPTASPAPTATPSPTQTPAPTTSPAPTPSPTPTP